jgi:hypothetical protein
MSGTLDGGAYSVRLDVAFFLQWLERSQWPFLRDLTSYTLIRLMTFQGLSMFSSHLHGSVPICTDEEARDARLSRA